MKFFQLLFPPKGYQPVPTSSPFEQNFNNELVAEPRNARERARLALFHSLFWYLADEIIVAILILLPARDIIRVGTTCRYMANLIQEESVWQSLFRNDFADQRLLKSSSHHLMLYKDLALKLHDDINAAELPMHIKSLLRLRFTKNAKPMNEILLTGMQTKLWVVNDLIQTFNKRPVIHCFAKRQRALDRIYLAFEPSKWRTLFQPTESTLLALLCNQVEAFKHVYFKPSEAKWYPLASVERFALYACWLGHACLLEHLFKMRSDLSPNLEIKGLRLLELATIEGQYKVMDVLFKQGADPQPSLNREQWFLNAAVRFRDMCAVQMYIKNKADPDKRDHKGISPREYAIRLDYREIYNELSSLSSGPGF